MKSKSYKQATCCLDHDCDFEEDDQICWGEVTVINEVQIGEDAWAWVHACEGHYNVLNSGGKYIPEC